MAEEKRSQEIQKAQATRAASPFEEMDRMFGPFMRGGWMRPWRMDWPGLPELALPEIKLPKVDVIDRENEVLVKAEIPGAEKKDLDISVGEDSVTIKGSTRHEDKEEKGDYYRCEISRGAFARTVALPATVDGARAKASFKDGMLELTLPKLEKARRHAVRVD